jgi:hypothetical protein
MNLLISLRTEILKTRRTAAFYLTLITAALIPFVFFMNICLDGVEPKNRGDILNIMFREGFTMNGFVILPMFIILLCTLLPQIEYKNNTWKQVLASPQKKSTVFIAKFLNIQFFLLVFLLANAVFMFVAAVGIHFSDPSLHILRLPVNGVQILTNALNAYLAALALTALQFWLGLGFRNFIIPMAIGLSGWLIGILLEMEYHSHYASYFPYSFHLFSILPNYKAQLPTVQWTSAGYALFFLVGGFLDFRKKRVHS